jgi:hypothetical protein
MGTWKQYRVQDGGKWFASQSCHFTPEETDCQYSTDMKLCSDDTNNLSHGSNCDSLVIQPVALSEHWLSYSAPIMYELLPQKLCAACRMLAIPCYTSSFSTFWCPHVQQTFLQLAQHEQPKLHRNWQYQRSGRTYKYKVIISKLGEEKRKVTLDKQYTNALQSFPT